MRRNWEQERWRELSTYWRTHLINDYLRDSAQLINSHTAKARKPDIILCRCVYYSVPLCLIKAIWCCCTELVLVVGKVSIYLFGHWPEKIVASWMRKNILKWNDHCLWMQNGFWRCFSLGRHFIQEYKNVCFMHEYSTEFLYRCWLYREIMWNSCFAWKAHVSG